MPMKEQSRPITFYMLLASLLFQGVSGLFGGAALILDPDGGILQLPVEMLQGSPFHDFLIPGIILFGVLGIFPLIVSLGFRKNRYLSWLLSLLVGVALLVWIGVEILIIGYHSQPPLQLIYGLLGILIVFLTLLPGLRRHFGAP